MVTSSLSLFVCIALIIVLGGVFFAFPAHAFFAEPLEVEITAKLCKIALALQGTVGRSLSAIAIMMLGLGVILGKISWPAAITVVLGIAVLYGSFAVVDLLTEKTLLGVGGVFSACAMAIVCDTIDCANPSELSVKKIFENALGRME